MTKTVLITGSTDGIGLATAKTLAQAGHRVILHGRSQEKLDAAKAQLQAMNSDALAGSYKADLSVLDEVKALAQTIQAQHSHIDVLINNAGIYTTTSTETVDHLDVRFMVNTIAPYYLSQALIKLLGSKGRVVNLSSAAQAPVEPEELAHVSSLDDGLVYAKSKLAITMWSRYLADQLGQENTAIIAVNPASFLGSKMVKEAYGMAGGDLQTGADILVRAALSDEFAGATGKYFDNDKKRFGQPHSDALDEQKNAAITAAIEAILL